MYELNLSRGGYRLLFWVARNNRHGFLHHGRDGWAVKAKVDLGYTQPMLSMLAKELETHGLLKRSTGGFSVEFNFKGE